MTYIDHWNAIIKRVDKLHLFLVKYHLRPLVTVDLSELANVFRLTGAQGEDLSLRGLVVLIDLLIIDIDLS